MVKTREEKDVATGMQNLWESIARPPAQGLLQPG